MIPWFKCLLLGHTWKVLSFKNYWDISYCDPKEQGAASHMFDMGCKRCKKLKHVSRYRGGHTSREEIEKIYE